jgi:predicted GIY-YIG superfamily endonuclease
VHHEQVRRRRQTTAATDESAGDGTERLHHRVYVVRLAHPRHPDVRDCYYVGMTGLTAQERFENHKAGVKAAAVVRRYGLELAYEWFDDIPPMTFADAAQCEPTLADELRDRGFVVFGPTNRPPPPAPPRARRRASKKR